MKRNAAQTTNNNKRAKAAAAPVEPEPRVQEFQCVRVHSTLDIQSMFRGKIGRAIGTSFHQQPEIAFHEFHPDLAETATLRRSQFTEITEAEAWDAVTPKPAPALPEGFRVGALVYMLRPQLDPKSAAARFAVRRGACVVRVKASGPLGVIRVRFPRCDGSKLIHGESEGNEFGVPTNLLQPYSHDLEDLVGLVFRDKNWHEVIQSATSSGGFTIRFIESNICMGSSFAPLDLSPSDLTSRIVPLNEAFPLNSPVRLMGKAKPCREAGARSGPNVDAYQGKVGHVVGHGDRAVRVDFSAADPRLTGVYLWPTTAVIRHEVRRHTFSDGQRVRLCADAKELKKWCTNHGGFKMEMFHVLGKEGTVVGIHPSGDLNVQFTEPAMVWRLNPDALTAVESEAIARSD